MSEANEDIVRRLLEANDSADLENALAVALSVSDPQVEFVSVLAQVEARAYLGHDGLRDYFADMADSFKAWRLEPEHVVSAGPDTVLAVLQAHITPKQLDAELVTRRALVCRLSGGRVVRARVYPSREEALQALGLER